MLTDAKPLTVDLAYITAWEDETGHVEWILFNQDGEIIMHSDNRSRVFFFAAEHEIPLVARHSDKNRSLGVRS